MKVKCIIFLCSLFFTTVNCSNITSKVFKDFPDGIPAAFGDFNSDDFIDVFVLRDKAKTLELFLVTNLYREESLLNSSQKCSFKKTISSVVLGDFDGDLSMDVLLTIPEGELTNIHILWGQNGSFSCTYEEKPIIQMRGQPLALDKNYDMIIDLFGSDKNGKRCFWIFNRDRTSPQIEMMDKSLPSIRNPHSNAFLDLNNDFYPDLMITTDSSFEIWNGGPNGEFVRSVDQPWPKKIREMDVKYIGQSLYLDLELKGKFNLIFPVCLDENCMESAIVTYKNGVFHELSVNFFNFESGDHWGFVSPHRSDRKNVFFSDAITLRGGDFDLDGYPDLLATFLNKDTGIIKTFLLHNLPCIECEGFSRNFTIDWHSLNSSSTTIMATFYDFYQDGMIDVILVEYDEKKDTYRMEALENDNKHYSTFLNVMMLTGSTTLKNGETVIDKKIGTNLPGASIAYSMSETDQDLRTAIAAQLPQSAHFSLNLPFVSFGLGKTPNNNIDELITGVAGKFRKYKEIIPNSQLVVIPNLVNEKQKWKILPFAIPKHLLVAIATALIAISAGILMIIIVLWWRERQEDRAERIKNAMSFHFDAL